MRIICGVIVCALIVLGTGCESRLLQQELEAAETALDEQRRENKMLVQEYEERIRNLQQESNSIRGENEKLKQQIAATSAELEEYRAYVETRKQQAERRREAMERRQRQREQARRRTEETTQRDYRVFDILFLGTQTHDGQTRDFGRFSIRNYGSEPLQVTARATGSVTLTVPANSVQESVMVPASRESRLKILTTSGIREYDWEN